MAASRAIRLCGIECGTEDDGDIDVATASGGGGLGNCAPARTSLRVYFEHGSYMCHRAAFFRLGVGMAEIRKEVVWLSHVLMRRSSHNFAYLSKRKNADQCGDNCVQIALVASLAKRLLWHRLLNARCGIAC